MSKNKDEDYYEDNKQKRLSVIKRIGITILIIIAIIILFFLLKGCDAFKKDKDLNTLLLEAGKEYYEYNDYLLPKSIGDCKSVTLSTLEADGLLERTKFNECEKDTTYVKVCKLESGKYHFVAFLNCASEVTENKYDNWKEGIEDDIIVDSSDLKFLFQVQNLNTNNSKLGEVEEFWEDEIKYDNYKTESTTKYYRYKDLQYKWNVSIKKYYPKDKAKASDLKEYYTSSPASGYIYKDSENKSVSKYYSVTGDKVYWVNSAGIKQFAMTAPDSTYIYSDNPIYQTRYQTRVWNETSKPATVLPTQIWYCGSATDPNQYVNSKPCDEQTNNPGFNITIRMLYSCDGGLTDVGKNGTCYQCTDGSGLRSDKSSCGSYGQWSNYTTTQCDTSSDLCQSRTLVAYNWYKLSNEVRKYYPSNASTSADEKTYYADAPASGLIKDDSTTTTGWKWYKKVDSTTTTYHTTAPSEGATKTGTSKWTTFTNWSTTKPASLGSNRIFETRNKLKIRQILDSTDEWLVFNQEYLEIDPLLTALQQKGYKVYSLDDINASGELKYKVKLYIRNKEVK